MRTRLVVFCALAILTIAVQAAGQTLPTLAAPVNDFAHVISPAAAETLDRRIRALQAATGDVVVVATVESLAPYGSIEEYAVRLFEKAGIGQKDKHNGVLVVMAVAERRVRIEVGYGLEEFITDGFAGDTIRQVMLPSFRAGDYGTGLVDGTTRVIQRIAESRGVALQDMPAPQAGASGRIGGLSPVLIVIMILILLMILRGSSRRGPPRIRRGGWGPTWSGWSGGFGGFGGGLGGGFGGFGGGGSGGGGFGGFGGGRSGGGGASGGW